MLVSLFGWDYQVLQLGLALDVAAIFRCSTSLRHEVVHGVYFMGIKCETMRPKHDRNKGTWLCIERLCPKITFSKYLSSFTSSSHI